MLLARRFGARVVAVDLAAPFLADLFRRAAAAELSDRILPVLADMAAPPLAGGSLDLVWSEGAAYAIGFSEALRAWRPLLAAGGCAVISEMTWFSDAPAGPALAFWSVAYPGMADDAGNRRRAEAAGFRPIAVHRLAAEAWWASYYAPLQARIRSLGPDEAARLSQVVAETEQEIDLFSRHGDQYGYAFYVLLAD